MLTRNALSFVKGIPATRCRSLSVALCAQRRFAGSAAPETPSPPADTAPPGEQPALAPLAPKDVAALLQSSPELTREVLLRLSPSKRRQFLVAASYYEWFGDEITAGQTSADVRNSGGCRGSYVEERNYATSQSADAPTGCAGPSSKPNTAGVSGGAPRHTSSFSTTPCGVITDSNAAASFSWDEMRRRRRDRMQRDEEHRIRKEMQEAHPIPALPMTKVEYNQWMRCTIQSMQSSSSSNSSTIPFRVLMKVALQTGLPFMAFGTLDNSMLILAGDMLDNWVGADLNLSPMGAAAMGGIVSGVVGIQIHGLAERAVSKYGPPPPSLKPSQWRSSRVQSAVHWGGTFGLMCGLFCGMFPLLLISDSSSVRRVIGDDDGSSPDVLERRHPR